MKHPVRFAFDASSPAGVHVAEPRQALIKVLLADAELVGEPAAICGGDLVHSPHLSDSLGLCKRFASCQCSSGPSVALERRDNRAMETASDRRRRKLQLLCASNGGPKGVGAKSGVSPASLDQILKGVLLPEKADGTRSPRKLGDDAARRIEDAYELPRGWFDAEDKAPAPSPLEPGDPILEAAHRELLGYFDVLTPYEQAAMLKEARGRAARVLGDKILAEKFGVTGYAGDDALPGVFKEFERRRERRSISAGQIIPTPFLLRPRSDDDEKEEQA